MIDNATPTIKTNHRSVMDTLRSGGWKLARQLQVPVSKLLLERMTAFGWIESRGSGPGLELKITPSGLVALRARSDRKMK